ncbi:hypothetical protein RF11_06182 [Thelohanellus kitauei]|uniref:Uncharacterized protein n=1 Tax=Thelohanellus kitauei TaxID=669202 RepID=A0A0C2MPV3_THEKT|nr:hypothetical protein RF11_06182 [Thelohanellus kitauei]
MSEDFEFESITGSFDTSSIPIYNSYLISTRIISFIKTTINFFCEMGLKVPDRTCSRCRKPCKLVKEKRKDSRFPIHSDATIENIHITAATYHSEMEHFLRCAYLGARGHTYGKHIFLLKYD